MTLTVMIGVSGFVFQTVLTSSQLLQTTRIRLGWNGINVISDASPFLGHGVSLKLQFFCTSGLGKALSLQPLCREAGRQDSLSKQAMDRYGAVLSN